MTYSKISTLHRRISILGSSLPLPNARFQRRKLPQVGSSFPVAYYVGAAVPFGLVLPSSPPRREQIQQMLR